MQLPAALRQAIAQELATCSTPQLRAASVKLSSAYREANAAQALLTDADRAAYLTVRLPATYAAVTRALRWARERIDGEIYSALDLGSGPGTALWAAAEVFPELASATAVERNPQFIAIAQRMAQRAAHPALSSAQWITANLASNIPHGSWDLVLCSYMLNELPLAQRATLVSAAWSHTTKLLILIEPGTKSGFANIAAAREQLLRTGPQIAAPCPHALACPMQAAGDWCHFAARVERTAEHRRLKDAELGHEDEKFSYIVFSRNPAPQSPETSARIVRHPQIFSGYAHLTLCTPQGTLERTTATRSQKDDWRRLKRLGWGDSW
jgi:ribosomal protein RSM22 (predicted rRNA methylase)